MEEINNAKKLLINDFESELNELSNNIEKCIDKKIDVFKESLKKIINDSVVDKNKNQKNINNENIKTDVKYLITNIIFQCLINIKEFYHFLIEKKDDIRKNNKTISNILYELIQSSGPNLSVEQHEKFKKRLMGKYFQDKPDVILNIILEQILEELNLRFETFRQNDVHDLMDAYKYYFNLKNEMFNIFYFVERIKKGENIYNYKAGSIFNLPINKNNSFNLEDINNFRNIKTKDDYTKIQKINNIFIINLIRDDNNYDKIKIPKVLDSKYLFEDNNNKNNYELISVINKEKINDENTFYSLIKDKITDKWFKYDGKEKKELGDFSNEQPSVLLIYHKINKK